MLWQTVWPPKMPVPDIMSFTGPSGWSLSVTQVGTSLINDKWSFDKLCPLPPAKPSLVLTNTDRRGSENMLK